MYFDVVGNIEEIETIAVGGKIRDIMRLRKQFGQGRWRELKGVAKVQVTSEEFVKLSFTGMKPTV